MTDSTTGFDALRLFDPDLATRLEAGFDGWSAPPDPRLKDGMARDILSGMAVEPAFGAALADGFTDMVVRCGARETRRYREALRSFAAHGPTLGRIMARALAPVVAADHAGLLDRFLSVVATMRQKGTHTLTDPLETLARLLTEGDRASADAYLALLAATYGRELTYNRTNLLTKRLPRAAARLPRSARPWQLAQLTRAMTVSDRLAERLWESLLDTDLGMLDNAGLKTFVADACRRFQHNEESGLDFAAMRSLQAREACASLRVAVALAEVRAPLGDYARLRLGRRCEIRAIADGPVQDPGIGPAPMVLCGADAILLADVMHVYPAAADNHALYRCLVRMACGVIECGTHDFDMDKASDRLGLERMAPAVDGMTDLACWWGRFPSPDLAAYLFSLFEGVRVHQWLGCRYPGILRDAAPFLTDAGRRIRQSWPDHPLTPLAVWSAAPGAAVMAGAAPQVRAAVGAFGEAVTPHGCVEDTAVFLEGVYPSLAPLAGDAGDDLPLLPFGRRILADRPTSGQRVSRRVQAVLARRGVSVYRSELVRRYREDGNTVTPEGVAQAVADTIRPGGGGAPCALSARDWAAVMAAAGTHVRTDAAAAETGGPAFWYPEWDGRQGDYRGDHVRVRLAVPATADPEACAEVLQRRYHLVARIRRAFELLRPQGLTLLRRWMEGDDFDYRALLDFAVDRRMGRTPSQRVYLKRLKAHRDVATLLLVDQSRSTAHPALGGRECVMDVEKAAIVLFCEALGVLGDRFAVAGFSGTGRLGVDFYPIKGFDDPMGAAVWARIAGMAPLRSTRMGAAIRHAAAVFAAVPAAVRLLIVLGDGFPNDVDYKKGYAIEDTRKAIQEAHAAHIHTHGITVNIAGDAGLDALYGGSSHTVISDVRELPDALWRLYARLTRQ